MIFIVIAHLLGESFGQAPLTIILFTKTYLTFVIITLTLGWAKIFNL